MYNEDWVKALRVINAHLTFTREEIRILNMLCRQKPIWGQSVLFHGSQPNRWYRRKPAAHTSLGRRETHHPGVTYRLPSVPKAHTSARLLCRKTSLLSGLCGEECCSFRSLTDLVEPEKRARRRG